MSNKIIKKYEEELLKADGFDEAIIGIDESEMRLIYSASKCIKILMENMNMEDAVEYVTFNINGKHEYGRCSRVFYF